MGAQNVKRFGYPTQLIPALPMVLMAALATSYVLYAVRRGRVARLVKIAWYVPAATGPGVLQIGYDSDAAGPVFTQCHPAITVVAGQSDFLEEEQIPICGNTKRGFAYANTGTAGQGTLGYISARCTCPGIGAGALAVQVQVEVEEEAA